MPSITSARVNYLVWRYLQEEGLNLAGYSLDRETRASHWDSQLKESVAEGELVKLILKGLQMSEIEADTGSVEGTLSESGVPAHIYGLRVIKAELLGGYASLYPSTNLLVVGGHHDAAAFIGPEFKTVQLSSGDEPTCIAPVASDGPDVPVLIGYASGAVRLWTVAAGSAAGPESGNHAEAGNEKHIHQAGAVLQGVFTSPGGESIPLLTARADLAGTRFAAIDARNILSVWDLAKREVILRHDIGGSDSGLVADLAWLNSATLAVAHPDGIAIMNTDKNEVKSWFRAHRRPVSVLAFDTASQKLASGGDDGAVYVWTAESPEPVAALHEHHGPITLAHWLGSHLLTASTAGQLLLWDVTTGQIIAAVDVLDPVFDAKVSGSYVATITKSGVKVHLLPDLRLIGGVNRPGVQSIAWSGTTLAITTRDETIVADIL